MGKWELPPVIGFSGHPEPLHAPWQEHATHMGHLRMDYKAACGVRSLHSTKQRSFGWRSCAARHLTTSFHGADFFAAVFDRRRNQGDILLCWVSISPPGNPKAERPLFPCPLISPAREMGKPSPGSRFPRQAAHGHRDPSLQIRRGGLPHRFGSHGRQLFLAWELANPVPFGVHVLPSYQVARRLDQPLPGYFAHLLTWDSEDD